MMSDIRHLTRNDFQEHYALTCYAFQVSPSAEQLEQARANFKPETWLASFQGVSLLSQMQIFDLEMYIQGNPLSVGGIGGVSTWPEARRQGLVAELLISGLERMKERGQTLSALAPFSFGFYRKYGWELYVEHKKYSIPVDKLPRREIVPGRVRRVRAMEHLEEIDALYAAYAKRYNGMLKRTIDWWEKRLLTSSSQQVAMYYRDGGEPGGYIRYHIHNREMEVMEFIYMDLQAFRALWSYVSQHDSMLERVRLNAPMDHPLPYLLNDPRIGQETVPYFMVRIVDAARFVEQYAFAPNDASYEKTELLLEIRDEHAPWNQGTWLMSIREDGCAGMVKLTAGAEVTPGHEAKLCCGINDLTAMLLGYMDPVTLHAYGRIDSFGAAADKLSSRIPKRGTYLLDFF
jgi:predicted acetyltransferase